jgi:outer membrane immunogenic protein
MKKWLLATVALGAHSLGTTAFAADLPVKAPVYKAPEAVLYSWTGCYVGANGGGKWARTSGSVNPPGVTAAGVTSTNFAFPLDDRASTFIGGGQVGCDWQTGHFVLGIEGDADWQRWRTTRAVTAGAIPAATATTGSLFIPGDSFDVSSRWQASLRGRLGYAWDRWLVYATGGVGFTSVRVGSNFIPVTTFPPTFATDSQTFAGPTVGAGIEYAFWQNVSLGVEARYTWYGSHTFNSGSVAAIAVTPTTFVFEPVTTSIRLDTFEVTARLNWKFDWAPTVSTRY